MRFALPLCLTLLAAAAPAGAEPFRATYLVEASGFTVMQIDAVFDLAQRDGYRIETQIRLRGIAATFTAGGQQLSRVEGVWQGAAASPRRYVTEGMWRGEPRQILVEYQGGEPLVRRLVPPNDGERDAVPAELTRNTVDTLSALAQLTRMVAASGRCDSAAATYDGRRRTDFTAQTIGLERLPRRGDGWSGEALRCSFEGRQVAGFLRNAGEEWRRPQTGTAWLASVRPGGPPVPVRIELPSRWFGTVTAYLTEASAAAPAQAGE